MTEGAPSTAATRFAQLRRAAELEAKRAQLEPWLSADPAKILALVAQMDDPAAMPPDAGQVTYACPMHPGVKRGARPLPQVRHETARYPGPSTATELLERILARDDAARSATTLQREQYHPAIRLGDAAGHYVDAVHVAAEDLAGREVVAALDVAAEQIVPGVTDEPAWPTLPAHLLLLAAHGADPDAQLATVAGSRELNSAEDRAAVLGWRLDRADREEGGRRL